MKKYVLLILVVTFSSGCVLNGSVRELGEKEKELIQAVQKRIKDNKPKVDSAAKTLGDLGAAYIELEFELDLALAKAKRLESMQAFLASPPDEFRETQQAVVLYHLYEIEQAERKVLAARIEQRRASVQEISTAYQQLQTLLNEAAKSLEIVLKYVNQPDSAKVLAFTETFLNEVKAFRETIESSTNPRLEKLAADVAQFEILAGKVKEGATNSLQVFTSLKGN